MSKEKGKTQNKKRKLTRQEKKQIDALIRQSKGDGKPHTAQDSIPFERMYKDGICRLANGRYSKCIEFEDINYQLAQPDDKTAIFEALCDMYNSFDASISVQLSLISRHANKEDFKSSITIAPQNDDFDSIRAEYTEMLQTQLERGNNGLIKTKFLTFTIEAKDIKSARARLARIETDTLNHFKVIGAAARVLDGKQRLEVLHGLFHPDGERFNFAWEWLPVSGLSVKDFIAPSSFRFGDGRMFQMGGKFGAVSFLQIAAPELSDRMLADFMEAENGIVVNLHIQSIDHNEAIKTIKRKITDLDRMKIEEQKKAIRSGYDMDIIPSDLATYGGEAKNLLRDLQSRNERMFLLTLLVLNLADTKQKLDNEVFGAAAIAQKYNCILTRLDYRQEQGLMSSIPLGENLIHIQRGLTTSSTAVFVPFTVQELFQSGEALYYGLNALSNNMILCDRKKLKNPNGLILGTPGSGKSFSAKREITNAFLITSDDIIICDPEAEYYPLVGRLKGQVIKVSQNSTQYINPMDINLNYSEGDTPIALKSDFTMLVNRDYAISSFKKEKYHVVRLNAGGVSALSERLNDEAAAQQMKAACEKSQAVCTSLKKEKKTVAPPKLFDLTALQREANRLYGFTAKQTLDYAQALYEKRLLTYPRTDSKYITSDMQDSTKELITGLCSLLPFMRDVKLQADLMGSAGILLVGIVPNP